MIMSPHSILLELLSIGIGLADAIQNLQGCLNSYWSRVTHICVSKLFIIGSDNGLSPGQHQAIKWGSAGILLMGPLRKKLKVFAYDEISIEYRCHHCWAMQEGTK